MRRANNKRQNRNKAQAGKRFLELTARVETLLETLEKERLEKKVADAKQELQDTGKTFLEVAARLRLLAEKHGGDHFVLKIDELVQRVEIEGALLLSKFDSLKSLPAFTVVEEKNTAILSLLLTIPISFFSILPNFYYGDRRENEPQNSSTN